MTARPLPPISSSPVARLGGALVAAALVLSGCGFGGPSPSPGPNESANPSPPVAGSVVFRATLVQALPPLARFDWLPLVVGTADGRLFLPGAVAAIYPGPLVPPIIEHAISGRGIELLIDAVRQAGLLTGQVDFTGGSLRPGQAAGRLEVVTGGRRYEMIGDPSRAVRCDDPPARCIPSPGTPEAFAHFWLRLSDVPGWLGPEVGPGRPHAAAAYGILVGPPPEEPVVGQAPTAWPLGSLASFGSPLVGDPERRCGLVTGEAAATLRPLLEAATEITPWFDPDAPNRHYGLVVRPLLPGDPDPCRDLIGS